MGITRQFLGAAMLLLTCSATAVLSQEWAPPKPGRADNFAASITAQKAKVLGEMRAVTDTMLLSPPPEDWLHFRRTYTGLGFSPLNQINRANVGKLKVAWSWSMFNGPVEITPLVHDGVMFVLSPGDHLQALDAATGDLLWEYDRKLPKGVNDIARRNLAIGGDKLLMPTADMHMLALDIHSGKIVWDAEIDDYKNRRSLHAGPLVVKDKVVQGVSDCGEAQPGGCFIVALDLGTGKEVWRFYTLARPDEKGGNSWAGLPLEKRFGGGAWEAGSYDPELNLIYWGTGQPYPWSSQMRGTLGKGTALFTDSTVALNPDTGKLVWYHQHLPDDSWNLDETFERELLDLNGRKVVISSGKLGIVDILDRKTGAFISYFDPGLQNIVKSIDPKTGFRTVDADKIPLPGKSVNFCPHPIGARSFPSTSLDPDAKILYMPLQEHCSDMKLDPLEPGEAYTGGGRAEFLMQARPDSDGNIGRLEAVDLTTGKPLWIARQRAPESSASLATAGGVVFQGSVDRQFKAYDAKTGAVLWQTRLNDVPNSFPVTYSAHGKQYVAVAVGAGSPYERSWGDITPDIKNPPQGGAQVWVFELPDAN